MCNGQKRAAGLENRESRRGAAMKLQLRWTGGANNFDIAPEDAVRMTGAQRFHRRFFGRKSSCKVRRRIPAAHGVGDLAVGEDAMQEPVAISVDGCLNTIDFRRVHSDTDNIHSLNSAGMRDSSFDRLRTPRASKASRGAGCGIRDGSMSLPQPNGPFEWVQESWGPALRCAPLAKTCRHLFTTRALELGGVRDQAANPGTSTRQPRWGGNEWSKLAAAIGVEPPALVRLRQVHGISVFNVRASEARQASYDRWPEADIATTCDPSVAVSVRAADCVPVLLADSESGAVAAVHAGWRGTAAGVVIEAVNALARTYGIKRENVIAAIGPSIGPCCYTVGEELTAKFARHSESTLWFVRREGLRLDLWRATRDQLLRAGLAPDHIHACELCTFDLPELFPSYRRDRDGAGRLVAAIRPNP